MRKIVTNDISKDFTIVTRILSDGGERIWEIHDMETAGFLKKEAVHASFSLTRTYFIAKKMLNICGTKHQILFKVPSIQSTFSLFFRSNTYFRRSPLSFKLHVFKQLFTDYSAIRKLWFNKYIIWLLVKCSVL